MKHKRKKRAVTLIEIMIVILLIGLIGGALAFNMRGSMDKGRVFKTQQNCARVYDTLMLAYAAGEFDLKDHNKPTEVKKAIEKSPLIKDPDKVLVDAWGENIIIRKKINKDNLEEDDLEVFSQKARDWENAH